MGFLNGFFEWVFKQHPDSSPNSFFFVQNYWESTSGCWLCDFMKHHRINPHKVKTTLASVFGPRQALESGIKIFYTGECVSPVSINAHHYLRYHDYMLDECDLSLGFDFLENQNYLRFPLWIMHFCKPQASFSDIKAKIHRINDPKNRLDSKRKRRKYFAALIASHGSGVRKELHEIISALASSLSIPSKWNSLGGVATLECPSLFMHNSNELKINFNNNKLEYLRMFRFNICPENASSPGYITEKLIDSFESGCVPIYWGGGGLGIEEDIFNQDSIIFYEKHTGYGFYDGKTWHEEAFVKNCALARGDGFLQSKAGMLARKKLEDVLTKLWLDESAYEEFANIAPFKEDAAERIYEILMHLKERLRALYRSMS